MSGRFTGMRHIRVRQDIQTRVSQLVKAKAMEEPPWLQVAYVTLNTFQFIENDHNSIP